MENFDYDLQSVQEARNLARLGKIATDKLADYTEEQIDKILQNMVRVAEENAVMLAKMAVEETGFGKVEDKTYKNHMASTIVYNYIKDMKCSGIIHEDPVNKMMEVADPVGLIMGIVPSTNPTSTAIYKSMIAIKARNAIVFSPHPSALQCTLKAATLMRDAAVAAGAPENVIGCLSMPSMGATDELMKCKETSMIIATGGPGMVKAAYSAGKPALGVGAGNSPSYIERTADVAQSVKEILASKTFDNGTVCASEQSVTVIDTIYDQVKAEFQKRGCYFVKQGAEMEALRAAMFKNGALDHRIPGMAAAKIAELAGIEVPAKTKILIAEVTSTDPAKEEFSHEKLSPVLAMYHAKDFPQAMDICYKLVTEGGAGHGSLIIFGAEDVSDARRAVEVCLREVERTMGDVYGSPAGHLEFQYTARASHALNKAFGAPIGKAFGITVGAPAAIGVLLADTAVKAATVDVVGYSSPANGGTSFSNEVILTFTGDSGAVKQAIIAARDVGMQVLKTLEPSVELKSTTTPYIL